QLAGTDSGEPRTDAEVAAALLRLYRERGADSLVGLNGRYTVCVWDSEENSLYLMNDILGLMPVFLWQKARSFAFGSNIWPIVCHPLFSKEIDPRGVVDLLLVSHQQANRTLLTDVSVLPPGSVTAIRGGKVTSRVARTLQFSDQRWDWGIDTIADAMYSLLEQSVRRRMPQGAEVLLPLSGGFDSRVMLGLLARHSATPRAITQYTYGWLSEDARYAKRLARRAGVAHETILLPDDFLAAYRRKCVAISGGLYDIHTSRYLSLLANSRTDPILTVSGHLGGELTGRFHKSEAALLSPEEHFDLAFKEINGFRFSPALVRRMLAGGAAKDLVDGALDECRQFFLSHDGSHFQRFTNWDLCLYRRRFISFQLLYLEQLAPVIAPFYDLDFADFMCSLPFAALQRQRAYREMICRHLPSLARVRNTNDLPLVVTTRQVVEDFLGTQYRRFVRRPLNRLLRPRRWVPHPNLQYGFALSGQSRGVLDHLVANVDRMAPYLNPDQVRDAVNRQLDGDSSNSMGLLALSAFVTTLEMLDDPYSAVRAWEDGEGPARASDDCSERGDG
ncbi:MAG: hypothetical protein KAX19_06545, partial [Candidatus Brocadiae bacterium]|nr:hypothetical protein [Candidatus Brocadiia bacterium]